MVCLLPAQPPHTLHKGFHKGWRAAEGRAPPFVEAAEGRLLYGWVCRGWAGSKHTKTLSPAKASFGAGPVPDPAVLVLDPAVLVLDPAVLVLRSMDINGCPWIIHGLSMERGLSMDIHG